MKILLVILHADSSRGGAELYTVTLFRKLLDADHDVKLAATTFEASIETEYRIPLTAYGMTRYGRYNSILRSLKGHTVGQSFDIVHSMLPAPCNVYHPHAGVEAIGWKQASVLQKMTNRRRRAFVEMERELLNSGSALLKEGVRPYVLCLSERAKAQAATAYPLASDRLLTLHSAVDETRFVPSENIRICDCIFIGQDFERKGLDIAIRAIALQNAYSLRVVGKDDTNKFRALARSLNIEDRVKFVGSTTDVAKELEQAHMLILPARQEPFGMVVPEAMLMGVPPIVSANAGASEIVRDGIDGRIITGEDPADWARAIADVIAHRQTYSASCLARRAELSYSHHLSTLLDLYERIVRERSL